MWSLANLKIKSNKQITSLNFNKEIESNPKTISKAFNKFFFAIAKNIDNNIIPTRKTHIDYLNALVVNSLFLTPICDEEAEPLIKEMNNSKSVVLYSISINILAQSYILISPCYMLSRIKTSSQAN